MLRLFLALHLLLLPPLGAQAQATLRVAGSASLVRPFALAAGPLKEQGIELKIDPTSSSSAAIAAVGERGCELGVSTRKVTVEERAGYPEVQFTETLVAYQAMAFAVSQDVWDAGVRSLSRAEMIRIYEGKITNWTTVGGEDRPIKFFNPEKGQGVWEFFFAWLYGDVRRAPDGEQFEPVKTVEEARNFLEFTSGSLSLLPPGQAESHGVRALALREEDGTLKQPTLANVRQKLYPVMRPVIAITAYRPAAELRRTLDFLLSSPGRALVHKAEFIPLEDEAPADTPQQ